MKKYVCGGIQETQTLLPGKAYGSAYDPPYPK